MKSQYLLLSGFGAGVCTTVILMSQVNNLNLPSMNRAGDLLPFLTEEVPSRTIPMFSAERRLLYQHHRPHNRTMNKGTTTELCGEAPDFASFFKRGHRERSSANDDQTIYKLFFRNSSLHRALGKMQYVELGAFNGMEESNTRFFDECLHWDGILIEANPKVYPNLVTNRPNAHRLSFAASCSIEDEAANKTVGFWQSAFTNSAEDLSVNRAAYASGHLRRFVQVPCGSMTPVILSLVPKGRVHFFSLDVEGMEPRVLETIDFSKVFVDVFLIEVINHFCEKVCKSRDETRAIMQRNGFIRYSDLVARSDIFINQRSFLAKVLDGKYVPSQLPDETILISQQTAVERQIESAATNESPLATKIDVIYPAADGLEEIQGQGRQVLSTRDSPVSVPQHLSPERRALYRYHNPVRRTANSTAATQLCGTAPDFTKFFKRGYLERSVSKEDRLIYELFFRQSSSNISPAKTYVELGAHNGKEESNSRFFDECLEWDGVLIEANPKIYPRLVLDRPHAHRLSFAASCSEEEEAANKTVGFWQSVSPNSVEDRSVNRASYASGSRRRFVEVPCGSLTPVLLDLVPGKRVSFFSLDVEGMESRVLETIDFAQIFVDVFIVQVWDFFCKDDCISRNETRDIMRKNGFYRYTGVIHLSDVFVNKRSPLVGKLDGRYNRSDSALEMDVASIVQPIVSLPLEPNRAESAANVLSKSPFPIELMDRFTPASGPEEATVGNPQQAIDIQSQPGNHAEPRMVSTMHGAPATTHFPVDRRTIYQYHPPLPRSIDTGNNTELCGVSPEFATFFQRGKKERSSSAEDLSMHRLFLQDSSYSSLSGRMQYVELGAFNGKEESNTRFFDECLQWDGVLIEANPVVFPKLLTNRPHAHRMSFAASCPLDDEAKNKTVGFWTSVFTNSVEDVSASRSSYAQGNQDRLVQVPCGSMTPIILDLVPNGHVHFFSLDVEGMEPRVLETIDFSKVFVDVFLIEVYNNFCRRKCKSRFETRTIMERNGFQRYSRIVPRSDIFVNKNSPISMNFNGTINLSR